MSGERKNTITKSSTANTTTKKGLSQGQADILIAIVAMTWGSSYLMMKIGLTGMPPFEIHDRFQCWIPGWYCVCIRTGSTQLFKTQTAIQTYNSWSPFGFTWNLPAYISLHLYN